ncbi:DUF6093 family protein [Occultella kanbiaonis]|uniref:DUF6093 family protein n=1 Tax=Occultella kanbiaonis TaxID=2675754 RepID=UPI0013D6A539|nr:DUF6093 family protein [Occultella kanbiaonis]
MPFPATRIIPTGWSAHHQPALVTSMNAYCVISDPTRTVPGAWNNETGTRGPDTPYVVYPAPGSDEAAAPCRVQRLQSATDNMQAGQSVTERPYLVTIPADAPLIEQGYVVDFTAAINDPHLAGGRVYVADVMSGSERFERDLVCTQNQG